MNLPQNSLNRMMMTNDKPARPPNYLSGDSQTNHLPPLASERLLIDSIETADFTQALVVSPGRGQAAGHLQTRCPSGRVTLWYVDAFRGARARQFADETGADIDVVASADLPDGPYQCIAMAVLMRGEAEMTRELLQQAHQRLEVGGQFIVSVNNPNDRWLLPQLQTLFDKVHCRQDAAGWVYRAIKQKSLKKVRQFNAEFTFRDGDRIVRIITRPSVFSHRRLDNAARVLIANGNVRPGDHVLDFGCGSGAVAIAAAIRSQTGEVMAVDCNHRAVQCVQLSAPINAVTNLHAIVNHDGRLPDTTRFDIALLNPPYYGDFAIAEHFVRSATAVVRCGGRILVVTKLARQYHERYHEHPWPALRLTDETEQSGYQLLTYVKL